jgi:serine/threonine-protein kinase
MQMKPNDSHSAASLTPERFSKVRAIFEAALEHPFAQRQAYAAGACGNDTELLREVEQMLAAEDGTHTLLPREPSQSYSSTHEEGRFPAGTVLAGRYRVLGLLGRGGMGEVYKAFDLILNQVVALKFLLPGRLSEAALMRLRNEVRIARQVSHPNVARVYDLGMVEGLHFLSMEFIDGENLKSLLHRIGRLPQDKAMELTRRICAGLAAAHERGVLHRDLKPANIMIDGRGQPRITDFGLAGLAEEIPLSDLRSGTPAYMSPEQKEGKDVTTRSDLYSLGLVLHEMFTGKARVNDSGAAPTTPSDFVRDLDPAIERLILRCLEDDPKRRPATALAVMMGLPGADPIAAALAVGETPSPEMVAASQEKEGFSVRAAVLCLVIVVVCMAAGAYWTEYYSLLAKAPLRLAPEALTPRAQEILTALGHSTPPVDSASGFFCCDRSFERSLETLPPEILADVLKQHMPAITHFWYRQWDQKFMQGDGPFNSPAEFLPANDQRGMIKVDLSPLGQLLRLEVRLTGVPPEQTKPDFPQLFKLAGLDYEKFAELGPEDLDVQPAVAGDRTYAWKGRLSSGWPYPVTVYAATLKGRVVWFQRQPAPPVPPGVGTGAFFAVVLIAGIMVFRNWRKNRVDGRTAVLISAVVFLGSLATGYGVSSFVGAGSVLVLYSGVEPYLRRYWPDSLISWNRLVLGRSRNPLVAFHILVGLAVGSVVVFCVPIVASYGASPIPTLTLPLNGLALSQPTLQYLRVLVQAPLLATQFLVVFVVSRLIIRRLWLADLIAAAILGAASAVAVYEGSFIAGVMVAIIIFISIALIRHFGFLTLVAYHASPAIAFTTLGTSGWLFERAIFSHMLLPCVAIWALWVILSAQSKSLDAA